MGGKYLFARRKQTRSRLAAATTHSVQPFELDPRALERSGFDRTSLAREFARRDWFHKFDFGEGLTTPGRDPSPIKATALELPDLTGASVIDIGAYDGYFSFECERRGARRVVASDGLAWQPEFDARRNFELIRTILDSRVETLDAWVEQLDGASHGTFDVALFLGVLYHATDMLAFLKVARSVTANMLVLETMVDALGEVLPVAVFYPPGTFPGDDSNHWGPNPACVEQMLYRVGFSRVERRSLWFPNILASLGARKQTRRINDGRMVFHAWV